MKKPLPVGSMDGPNGMKAFAKQLVGQYRLGVDAARFSVVSFASDATTRVEWSYSTAVINAGIDQMSADGKTSISDGFEAARQLFDRSWSGKHDGRVNATKVVLFLTDGEQSIDAAPGKTLSETAVDAAALVKGDDVTVHAWGFGDALSRATLEQIATDPSKVILAQDIAELTSYLVLLQAAACNHSPPSPSSPPPSPLSPPGMFTTKASLQTALQAFNANPTAATVTYGPIADWDVSAITDMSNLFSDLTNFSADISGWDTSSVTDMSQMFSVRSPRALGPHASFESGLFPVHASCVPPPPRTLPPTGSLLSPLNRMPCLRLCRARRPSTSR